METLKLLLLFWFTNQCLCRVLVEDSLVQDDGSFVQYLGIKFSLNGKVDGGLEEKNCSGIDCSPDPHPLPEIDETITKLLNNASFLEERTTWKKNLKIPTKPHTKDHKVGLKIHHRQKRLDPVVTVAIVQGIFGLLGGLFGGGKEIKVIEDPYAERKFLMEKDRTAMETIKFCTSMCAEEWGQWGSCTKQCGGGLQSRSRFVDHDDPMCGAKFLEYFNATFQCPHRGEEERPCNDGCPNGGEPSFDGCSCPDGWGGSCCERKLYCTFPGQPANGDTILNVSPIPVGSIAMFQCHEGFVLQTGVSRHAVCKNDQTWSENVPTCQRIECPRPSLRPQLQVMNEDSVFDFGQTIHYGCNQGYVLNGPEHQMCQRGRDGAGRWTMYTPQCSARECPAPTQADIPHGMVQGADNSYNSSIAFECWPGYDLIGLDELVCTKHGRWSGFYPVCQEISCTPPYPPTNGDMQLYGKDTVMFSCQEGYKLTDETKRVAVCQDDGQWSISTPTCQAIECDGSEINQIENGFVNGGIYRFPFSVKFGCYPGYVLQGLEEISCQENGEWSGDAPRCKPCPVNTYMEDWSTGGLCIECPDNSHTATEGSTNRQQCICDDGYSGDNGGPCQEVKCPVPNVPINGARGTCELSVGQTCSFTCDPGYIPSSGANVIECLANGEWSNQGLSCSACAANTYNPPDQPNICMPCPDNMSTEGATGQVLEGCLCKPGWQGLPGGPCADVDECQTLTGGFACEDQCVNSAGSYHCECSRPGTVLNADGHTCDVEDSCRELKKADAPTNGALLCTHNEEESSRFCAARCDKGYEFAGNTPNSYETCDASTNFDWPFESLFVSPGMNPAEARIADCVPEFFPGFQLNAEIFYLSGVCENLTPEQQDEVKNAFVGVLENGNVCFRSPLSCSIENVQIVCGARKKRDASGNTLESVDFNFNVTFGNVSNLLNTLDCDSYVCPLFRVPAQYCARYCATVLKNYAKGVLRYAENNLAKVSENMDRVRFSVLEQSFVPEDVKVNDKSEKCMRPRQEYVPATNGKQAFCRSCQSGQFYNTSENCEPCPAGTHQLLPDQTSCPPCPTGSYSGVGWSYCLTCEDGYYGENCSQQCSCVHGKCNKENGECNCDSGWEGPDCSVDIDRCQSVACPAGQTCQDKQAPEDGFECV